MAKMLSTSLLSSSPSLSSTKIIVHLNNNHNFNSFSFLTQKFQSCNSLSNCSIASYRISSRGRFIEEEEEGKEEFGYCCSFEDAVELFNKRDYYKCHDVLEALWNNSQEPTRTLVHGILQCAVGFHHLFNQNHKGAMMELGEGLCKLRKMNFESGPFLKFEKEIAAALDFIYHTQIELAACTDDLCLTMDQSETSYQLLGAFAAGEPLYRVENAYIVFCAERFRSYNEHHRIKVPILHASEDYLSKFDYN